MHEHLSRTTDPATSAAAAATLDLAPHRRHEWVLDWLRRNEPATDMEMAEAAHTARIVPSIESGRRLARTLREEHRRIRPAHDERGQVITRTNVTGRKAIAYEVGYYPPPPEQPHTTGICPTCHGTGKAAVLVVANPDDPQLALPME